MRIVILQSSLRVSEGRDERDLALVREHLNLVFKDSRHQDDGELGTVESLPRGVAVGLLALDDALWFDFDKHGDNPWVSRASRDLCAQTRCGRRPPALSATTWPKHTGWPTP